jgi:hypothetical protein
MRTAATHAPPPAVTLALAAVFAVLAAWPWVAPEPSAARAPAPLAAASVEPPSRDASSLAAVVGRPLFSPSRRPVVAENAASAGSARAIALRVEGVIEIGGRRRAIIRREGAGESVRVSEGDMVEGWTVRSIASERVVLVSPSGELVLPTR